MTEPAEARSVELLRQLQAIEYALVELNFYLDTVPDKKQAKERNHALSKRRDSIRKQLQSQMKSISSYEIVCDSDNRKWRLAP